MTKEELISETNNEQDNAVNDTTSTIEEGVETKDITDSTQEEVVDDMETETFSETKEEHTTLISGVSQDMFNQLTKKNQQFIVSVERQIRGELATDVEGVVFKEIAETLIQGQEDSHTAKYIYGTPTELAQVIREQKLQKSEILSEERSSDLLVGIDGALFLGSLFTMLTGLSMVAAKNPNGTEGYMGIITVFINYFVAGLAMLATSKYLPRPDAPKGKKGYGKYFLVSILSMLMWFFVVSGSNFALPRVINPVLPGVIYMMLGGVTFVLRYFLKKHYNIKGGIF